MEIDDKMKQVMKRIFLFLLFAAGVAVAGAQSQEYPRIEPRPRVKNQHHELKAENPRQEAKDRWYDHLLHDTIREEELSLYPMDYWDPYPIESAVPMSSVVVVKEDNKPRKIDIIPYKVRSGWFTISNGQAQNWSPFPDAYLDARTLSFPHSGRM